MSKVAIVVVIELLSGSRSTLPHPPVTGSTRFGTFPAAIRSPSGLPEIASPLMNRAAVNAEATVVSSLTVTVVGDEVPSSAISTMASSAFGGGFQRAAFGDQIQHGIRARDLVGAKLKSTISASSCLS